MTDRQWTEWAVEFDDDGIVDWGTDEAEARAMAKREGGRLLVRKVFETSWLGDPRDRQAPCGVHVDKGSYVAGR